MVKPHLGAAIEGVESMERPEHSATPPQSWWRAEIGRLRDFRPGCILTLLYMLSCSAPWAVLFLGYHFWFTGREGDAVLTFLIVGIMLVLAIFNCVAGIACLAIELKAGPERRYFSRTERIALVACLLVGVVLPCLYFVLLANSAR
jgi:amino acid transporter